VGDRDALAVLQMARPQPWAGSSRGPPSPLPWSAPAANAAPRQGRCSCRSPSAPPTPGPDDRCRRLRSGRPGPGRGDHDPESAAHPAHRAARTPF
jgi:hypothetical protein